MVHFSLPTLLAAFIALCLGSLTFLRPLVSTILGRKRQKNVVAFFHPYTNDGGGGEKVLWCAVRAIQDQSEAARCVVYTGDEATSESLRLRALERFGVKIDRPVEVLRLYNRVWIEPSSYPRFTLICQSLGSMVLAWEALWRLTPVLFLDTAGYAFTYPIAALYGCHVACYTHYPTVSTDMLQRVRDRRESYNNSAGIAGSDFWSDKKVSYYQFMAWLYGVVGRFASVVMVNSSWTEGHIKQLWGEPNKVTRVYPPCDTTALNSLPLERPTNEAQYIVSVAQFRPEKAHALQLKAFKLALDKLKQSYTLEQSVPPTVRLKIVGSCRHREDEERIEMLSSLALSMGIESKVDFCVNVPYSELRNLLGGAVAGLHTMTDEHFGISIVEYMAAGAIPIAHNSGGPKQDIVVPQDGYDTGYLATSSEEYADAICQVLTLPESKRLEMAEAARKRASTFSETNFDRDFKLAMSSLVSSLIGK